MVTSFNFYVPVQEIHGPQKEKNISNMETDIK